MLNHRQTSPSRGDQRLMHDGVTQNRLAIIAFFVACPLSILIEYFVLARSQKGEFPLHALGPCTALANIFGYMALGLAVFVSLRYFL